MGKIVLLAIFLGGCAPFLQTVYRDDDRGVFKEEDNGDRLECQKAYSSWDGREYWDYYGPPCQILIKRRMKGIPNVEVKHDLPITRSRN